MSEAIAKVAIDYIVKRRHKMDLQRQKQECLCEREAPTSYPYDHRACWTNRDELDIDGTPPSEAGWCAPCRKREQLHAAFLQASYMAAGALRTLECVVNKHKEETRGA